MHEYKILTCVVLIVVMPDGWENRQIVFIVRVEAKQQFLSEIPYVGAILSLVSARIPHTYDSPPKAEPLILWMSIVVCRWNFRAGNGCTTGYIRVYSLERQGVMILYLVHCTILSKWEGKCNENGYLRDLLVCFENVALSLCCSLW